MPPHRVGCHCDICQGQHRISASTRWNHRKDDAIAELRARLDQGRSSATRLPSERNMRAPDSRTFAPAIPRNTQAPVTRVDHQSAGTSSSVSPGTRVAPRDEPVPAHSGSTDPHFIGQEVSQRPRFAPNDSSSSDRRSTPQDSQSANIQFIETRLVQLSSIEVAPLHSPLEFQSKPADGAAFDESYLSDYPQCMPNNHYSLNPRVQINGPFLTHEDLAWKIVAQVHMLPGSPAKQRLENRAWEEIIRCARQKGAHWDQQRTQRDGQVVVRSDVYFAPLPHQNEPAVLSSMILAVMMTKFFRVPLSGGNVALAALNNILTPPIATGRNTKSHLPRDINTAVKQLRLNPVVEEFVCCSKCWALTPSIPRPTSLPIPSCQERWTPGSDICGQDLWRVQHRGPKLLWSPILTYTHQPLKHWLARLLSRPGIEDILEQYPARASQEQGYMTDLWSSPRIRALEGPDKRPFLDPEDPRELRLLLGYATDAFNPFYNKTAKQSASTTGFWLSVYNFPPGLRILFDNNCYLGAASGPKPPTVGHLNSFQHIMVAELQEFWDNGVVFTRTYKYRHGRRVRAMFIPLTADMKGLREAAGLTSPTSTYFCVGCHLDMAHIEEFDRSKWPKRSLQRHMECATAWKDAPTAQARKKLEKDHGIRWTPLLLLTYWIIILYLLIETMHALDLGLIEHHCRDLWCIDLSSPGGDGSEPRMSRPRKPTVDRRRIFMQFFISQWRTVSDLRRDAVNRQTADAMGAANRQTADATDALNRQTAAAMEAAFLTKMLSQSNSPYPVLWHICKDLGLRVAGGAAKRVWYLLRIKKWVESNPQIADEDLVRQASQTQDLQDRFPLQQLVEKAETKMAERSTALGISENQLKKCQKCIGQAYRSTQFASVRATGGAAVLNKILLDTCHLNAITDVNGSSIGNCTNQVLYDCLCDEARLDKQDNMLEQSPTSGPVLGADVMAAVRDDMSRTVVPSWMAAVPKDWGTQRRGKLSADYWRTIVTVHLVITLMWHWRNEVGRTRDLMINLLDLVVAVRMAKFKRINRDLGTDYDFYLSRYIEGVAELFPENTIKPNMHNALHIGENLRDFGPSHSHGAQFYERYIHRLQRQNTNMQFGKLESTFMKATAQEANLRSIINDNPAIRQAVMVHGPAERHREMDTFLMNPDGVSRASSEVAKQEDLSSEHHQMLREYLQHKHGVDFPHWQGTGLVVLQETSIDGIAYRRRHPSSDTDDPNNIRRQIFNQDEPTRVANSDKDCDIIFHFPPHGDVPGQIVNMFRFAYTILADGRNLSNFETVFLIVNRYASDLLPGDPYRCHHAMFGYLVPIDPVETVLIEAAEVRCNFAPTPRQSNTGEHYIHVLPLSRVDLGSGLDAFGNGIGADQFNGGPNQPVSLGDLLEMQEADDEDDEVDLNFLAQLR